MTFTDDPENKGLRLMESIHELVKDMSPKEMKALKTRYTNDPKGWATVERALTWKKASDEPPST